MPSGIKLRATFSSGGTISQGKTSLINVECAAIGELTLKGKSAFNAARLAVVADDAQGTAHGFTAVLTGTVEALNYIGSVVAQLMAALNDVAGKYQLKSRFVFIIGLNADYPATGIGPEFIGLEGLAIYCSAEVLRLEFCACGIYCKCALGWRIKRCGLGEEYRLDQREENWDRHGNRVEG